jgi:3-deoxy-D-manno-octulosonate 8-phosphate phosphatase (KDO 8-P phosphatase)
MLADELTARARAVRLLTCDVDGVLTDGKIYVDEDGRELKAYCSLDGLGMKMLGRHGVTVAWITGSRSAAVARRAANLGIEHVIQGAEEKLAAWERLRTRFSLAPEQCAHIGDDLPDLPIIVRCGLGATVPHSPEIVRRQAHYVTHLDGGRGAVRELAELILAARGALDEELRAFDVVEHQS